MGRGKAYSMYSKAPIFYEPGPRRGQQFAVPGQVLDPRRLGPLYPRVLVCDTVFRLKDRYYIGNPRNQPRGPGRRSVLLHRVVYEAVWGSIPKGYEVHHIDDDPFNNHPDNLEALPRFSHRSSHKSEPRYVCTCEICGREFGCYQAFGKRCGPECKRIHHARLERERRARVQPHSRN